MLKLLVGLMGIVSLVAAIPLLFGGGSLVWIDSALADSEGFVNTAQMEIEVDGYALVAGPAQIDILPTGPIDVGEIATIRIQAENQNSNQGLFIGVADADTVNDYLGGVPHAIVEELEPESISLTYHTDLSGTELSASPGDQPFWTASSEGTGGVVLEWEIERGEVSFVIMNDDAADGLAFDAVIGARVPVIRPIGVSLLIGGGLTLAIGTLLLALAL